MKFIKNTALALALFGPSAVLADSVENYFSAHGYKCGEYSYIAEWSVIGDLDGDVSVQQFLRRADLTRAAFEDFTWQFSSADLSGPVAVSNTGDQTQYELTDMLSDTPKVTVLDASGTPRADCSFTLEAAQNPSERFDLTINTLNLAEPNANDARVANDLISHLPPSAMLPALSQEPKEEAVKTSIDPFWSSYEATVLSRAANLEDTVLLDELTQYWLEQELEARSLFHGTLLLQAQEIRANALQDQGEDPTQIATLEDGALCTRIDGFNIGWEWDEYLELATGLPLEFLTDALAEDILALSNSCENGISFQTVMSSR